MEEGGDGVSRLGLPRLVLQGLEVPIQHAARSHAAVPVRLLQLLRRKRVAAALAFEAVVFGYVGAAHASLHVVVVM